MQKKKITEKCMNAWFTDKVLDTAKNKIYQGYSNEGQICFFLVYNDHDNPFQA